MTAAPRVPAASDVATLLRLELLRVRAFWRFATRDVVFDLCVLAGLAFAYGALLREYSLLGHAPVALRLFLSAGAGGLLVFAVHAGPGSRARERLMAGPFHALVARRRRLDLWMAVRAVAGAAAVCALIATGLATVDAAAAVAFLVASIAGAAVAGAVVLLRPAGRSGEGGASGSRPRRRSGGGHPALVIARAAFLRGRIPAGFVGLVLVVVGGAAGFLAARNNGAPELGLFVAAGAALAAGALMFPAGRLPGLLGQEPGSLGRLYLWLYAGPLAMAAAGGAAGGALAGLGPAGALETALTAAVGLAVVSWFFFLHRLIRSERHARLSAGLEFAGAAFLATDEVSLAPLWLAARGLVLVRAARRRRWLDR
ncbi:MAG TPA: hypothetical protein VG939_09405 [Caulobacteraceae bacterium]|nr:hypothetical protein [Caulobacteraceae bacterium]